MRIGHAAAAVLAIGLIAGSVGTADAAGGCGPGFHRGFYGACRPNFGWGPGWHRWGGYHPYGWHRWGWRGGYGWHRRWG